MVLRAIQKIKYEFIIKKTIYTDLYVYYTTGSGGILASFFVQDFVEIIFFTKIGTKSGWPPNLKKGTSFFLMVENILYSSHEYSTEVCQPPWA